jgi:transposase
MDNYATHKTAVIKTWLARRPHYHGHFTPTSASWINQVERRFAELTRKQLRRCVHTSTKQLETDIRAFIERHNDNPKPYYGPNPQMKFSRPSNASAKKPSRRYAANFRFT